MLDHLRFYQPRCKLLVLGRLLRGSGSVPRSVPHAGCVGVYTSSCPRAGGVSSVWTALGQSVSACRAGRRPRRFCGAWDRSRCISSCRGLAKKRAIRTRGSGSWFEIVLVAVASVI